MYIKNNHSIRWKIQYVPTYYEGLNEDQEHDQRIVLNFKDGNYNDDLMLWFRQNIWKLTEGDEYSWSVCFLPCSSDEEQQKRFGKLEQYLKENTRIEIHLSTFGYVEKQEPSHYIGKSDIDLMNIALHVPDIYMKNVILIDDVITTGETFNRTAEQAMRMGANSVHGLFLAKTIHPALPMKEKNSQREDDESIIREEAEIMKTLSNLPPEDKRRPQRFLLMNTS